jgi:Flp pilus assembly protein TadB
VRRAERAKASRRESREQRAESREQRTESVNVHTEERSPASWSLHVIVCVVLLCFRLYAGCFCWVIRVIWVIRVVFAGCIPALLRSHHNLKRVRILFACLCQFTSIGKQDTQVQSCVTLLGFTSVFNACYNRVTY